MVSRARLLSHERAPRITSICLDLNVWIAELLATTYGRTGTTAQILVNAVRDGSCAIGLVQLVISWGMLDRLRLVLAREFAASDDLADTLIAAIATIARTGPSGTPPYILLGGTGVLALRDQEDSGVLETAFAGSAAVLATYDFADFIGKDTSVVVPKQIAIARRGTRQVIIAIPRVVRDWIRDGEIVLPK